MAYRQQLYISPTTLTDLTVTIEYDNQEIPSKTATLNDFSIVNDELNTSFPLLDDCTVTIQSQGYETKILNITTEYYEDKHIVLTPLLDYFSKVSDGTNIYWVKDIDAREMLETKANTSDIPTAISDLTDDTSTTPVDKADTLTGLTASVAELNYTDGVTSNIQTQLNGKADVTLSNVSSIDNNSAVKTALDTKVNSSDIWYDSMTSTLYIGVPQS